MTMSSVLTEAANSTINKVTAMMSCTFCNPIAVINR